MLWDDAGQGHTRPALPRVLLREVLPWQVVLALCFRAASWFRAAELFLQPGGACVSMHRSRSLFGWQETKDALPSAWGALMPSQPFLHPRRDGTDLAQQNKGLASSGAIIAADEEGNSAPV